MLVEFSSEEFEFLTVTASVACAQKVFVWFLFQASLFMQQPFEVTPKTTLISVAMDFLAATGYVWLMTTLM